MESFTHANSQQKQRSTAAKAIQRNITPYKEIEVTTARTTAIETIGRHLLLAAAGKLSPNPAEAKRISELIKIHSVTREDVHAFLESTTDLNEQASNHVCGKYDIMRAFLTT